MESDIYHNIITITLAVNCKKDLNTVAVLINAPEKDNYESQPGDALLEREK